MVASTVVDVVVVDDESQERQSSSPVVEAQLVSSSSSSSWLGWNQPQKRVVSLTKRQRWDRRLLLLGTLFWIAAAATTVAYSNKLLDYSYHKRMELLPIHSERRRRRHRRRLQHGHDERQRSRSSSSQYRQRSNRPHDDHHGQRHGNYQGEAYHRHYYSQTTNYTAYKDAKAHKEEEIRRQRNKDPRNSYSKLTDVWLCLLMALGWTVWMLSSFIKTDLLKYNRDSVIIRGHVLEVSVIPSDSLGTGIPTYKAVIDYMVENDTASYQIRKHFETQHLLEEGFANVELLVLPQEPTNSVLREDWEMQVEEHKNDESESLIRSSACRRLSMTFAGMLVLASLGGCIQVVVRLDPLERWKGWLSLCVGAALLLPLAVTCLRVYHAFQRTLDFQSEKAGIVLRGASAKVAPYGCINCQDYDVLDARACDEEAEHVVARKQAKQQQLDANNKVQPEAADCYFVTLPSHRHRHHHHRRGTSGQPVVLIDLTEQQQSSSGVAPGCLMTKAQIHHQQQQQQQQDTSSMSSVSSVSSISLGDLGPHLRAGLGSASGGSSSDSSGRKRMAALLGEEIFPDQRRCTSAPPLASDAKTKDGAASAAAVPHAFSNRTTAGGIRLYTGSVPLERQPQQQQQQLLQSVRDDSTVGVASIGTGGTVPSAAPLVELPLPPQPPPPPAPSTNTTANMTALQKLSHLVSRRSPLPFGNNNKQQQKRDKTFTARSVGPYSDATVFSAPALDRASSPSSMMVMPKTRVATWHGRSTSHTTTAPTGPAASLTASAATAVGTSRDSSLSRRLSWWLGSSVNSGSTNAESLDGRAPSAATVPPTATVTTLRTMSGPTVLELPPHRSDSRGSNSRSASGVISARDGTTMSGSHSMGDHLSSGSSSSGSHHSQAQALLSFHSARASPFSTKSSGSK